MYINSSNYVKNNSLIEHNASSMKNNLGHGARQTSMTANLTMNAESYSVFISSEAALMVTTKTGEGGNLIVGSDEDKEALLSLLGKNENKIVNQDMKKFCEENGIDMSQPIEKLEAYTVVITEEMKREQAMYADSQNLTGHANSFVNAFNLHNGSMEGSFIGQYPPEAIYKMYEKRFGAYVRELTEYIDKYGRDPELRQNIYDVLNKKNPDGKNEVANLVKEITDRIYDGKGDTVNRLIEDKAEEAYQHTYKKEIAAATEAEKKRTEKFMEKMKKTEEQMNAQKEVLQTKIKKLQEQIQEKEKDLALRGEKSSDQVRQMKKNLEELEKQLSALSKASGGMPPSNQNWDDISVMVWHY